MNVPTILMARVLSGIEAQNGTVELAPQKSIETDYRPDKSISLLTRTTRTTIFVRSAP